MELLFFPFLFCGGLLFLAFFSAVLPIWGIYYSNRLSDARRRAYRAAATHVGLTQVVERLAWGAFHAVEGVAEPFRVWISAYRGQRHENGTRITISGKGLIPSGLDLRSEGLASQMGKALGGKEIVIGDADLDRDVYVRGPEDVLRALCNARTRSLLRALARMNGVVANGSVRVQTAKAPEGAEPVTAVLETALELARCLVTPENVVERIADLVRSDPEMGVRERCLGYLLRAYPQHPTVSAVIREALTMPSAALRVRAAIALGAEGHETLLGLVGSPELDAECAAEGIRALGEALPEARSLEILQEALRLGRHPVAGAAIDALALRGTAQAVPPLRAAIESPALDSALRREAHAAIARIQSRIEGAEAGQISVADPQADAGQLSLSETASGRLSLDQPATAEHRSVSPTRATDTE
jgi:hypothetical protein